MLNLKNKEIIVFLGELTPKTIHGASISNSLNLKMLNEMFEVIIVEEFREMRLHNRFSISKSFNYLKTLIIFFNKVKNNKCDYFYSVIYLSSFGILKNLISVFIYKIFNKRGKVILHFHRSDFNKFKENKFNNFIIKILNILVYKYIVLSKKSLSDLTISMCNKALILTNTLESENFYFRKKPLYIKNNNLNVIYIGNFIEDKGVIELIKAIQIFNNNNTIKANLDMFGSFTSNSLKNLIFNLVKNDSNINIYDKLLGDDKLNAIYDSDLFILPSYNEGLPISLLECLFLGTPIIISNVGYIEDALGSDFPLYCIPKNVNSIVEKINYFINNDINLNFQNMYKNYSHNVHKTTLTNIFK